MTTKTDTAAAIATAITTIDAARTALLGDLALTFDTFEVQANDLPGNSIRYLIAYGFRKSMQDAGAISKDQIAKWRKADDWSKRAKDFGIAKDADDTEIRAAYGKAKAKIRLDDILAGKMSESGPVLDELTRETREIAKDRIKKILAAGGTKQPTEVDEWNRLVDAFLAGPAGVEIEAAAKAVIAARNTPQATGGMNAADLLAAAGLTLSKK